jgi:hypothetical protein
MGAACHDHLVRIPFEATPIGHMIDARELAEKRMRRSGEMRILRELAATARLRRMERIATGLRLHRLATSARRAATAHAARTRVGAAGPANVQQHIAWW